MKTIPRVLEKELEFIIIDQAFDETRSVYYQLVYRKTKFFFSNNFEEYINVFDYNEEEEDKL